MNRNLTYIMHILDMIEEVTFHLSKGQNARIAFFEDRTIQAATLRSLQLMAESCKRLSEETRSLSPEVDWPHIMGFRNILVHDYLGDINLKFVWDVIENHLPPLKASMLKLKEKLQ